MPVCNCTQDGHHFVYMYGPKVPAQVDYLWVIGGGQKTQSWYFRLILGSQLQKMCPRSIYIYIYMWFKISSGPDEACGAFLVGPKVAK